MNIKEILRYGVEILKGAKVENPRMEAEILLSHTIGKDKIYLITRDEEEISAEDAEWFKKAVNRRVKSEPTAYILGYKEFYGRKFYVNRETLIPRPETEMLVDLVKEEGKTKILDLCAGSGCIGLTLAKEIEGAEVTLSDISKKAADIIRKNAQNLDAKVTVTESDLFDNIKGKFDAIVSNPPYIKSGDIDTLSSDVKDYEPRMALDGGKDGLKFYRKIIPQLKNYLTDNGTVYFEIGFDEGEKIKQLLLSNSFANVKIHKDLANLNRAITGNWVLLSFLSLSFL